LESRKGLYAITFLQLNPGQLWDGIKERFGAIKKALADSPVSNLLEHQAVSAAVVLLHQPDEQPKFMKVLLSWSHFLLRAKS